MVLNKIAYHERLNCGHEVRAFDGQSKLLYHLRGQHRRSGILVGLNIVRLAIYQLQDSAYVLIPKISNPHASQPDTLELLLVIPQSSTGEL